MSEQQTLTANPPIMSEIAPMPMDVLNAQISNTAPNRVIGRPWQPGESGNPGGRPAVAHITEAYKEILETEGAAKYARVVTDIATNPKIQPNVRLQAVQEITDRVEGKAVQNTNVRGLIVMMPADAVLADTFNGSEPE